MKGKKLPVMSPGLIHLFKGVIGGLINGGAYIPGRLINGGAYIRGSYNRGKKSRSI